MFSSPAGGVNNQRFNFLKIFKIQYHILCVSQSFPVNKKCRFLEQHNSDYVSVDIIICFHKEN